MTDKSAKEQIIELVKASIENNHEGFIKLTELGNSIAQYYNVKYIVNFHKIFGGPGSIIFFGGICSKVKESPEEIAEKIKEVINSSSNDIPEKTPIFDINYLMGLIKKNPCALAIVPTYHPNYYELADYIVNKDPCNMQYVSTDFDKYYEFAIKAIKKDYHVLKYVNKHAYYFELAVYAVIKEGREAFNLIKPEYIGSEKFKLIMQLNERHVNGWFKNFEFDI
jgi:hypothetical protein